MSAATNTLDTVTQDHIHDVISEWIEQGRLFTAFEVSLAVKERGTRYRHRRMRDYIHNAIARLIGPASYTRTLMDVGAPGQAWVYHPVGANPYGHRALDRSDLAPSTPSHPRSSRRTGTYGPDQRGRVCIPVGLLSRIGIRPGDRVNVVCDSNTGQVILTPAGVAPPSPSITTYTAERDGNVRVTHGVLEQAGLDGMHAFAIDGSDTAICVRRYA